MSSVPRLSSSLAIGIAAILAVAACTSGASPSAGEGSPAPSQGSGPSTDPSADASPSPAVAGSLVVYSGRSEELVGPLIERFETATGVDVDVRYAGTTELATTILEEGDSSPADVFFAQDGGALGALAREGRLTALPDEFLDQVDTRFRAGDGRWVGVSGRARVLAYDTRELAAGDLPASVTGLADPAWKGRIGWVPSNASFQTFVTALRAELGEDGARQWLTAMQANEPRVYEGNAAALEAVRAGEIDAALINHYYLFQAQAESGADYPVANHYFTGGDAGALVNVAGVGVLDGANHPAAANAFVRFLLDPESQAYFSRETFEYPLVGGMAADPRLPALDQIDSPDLDLSDLTDLEGTVKLLTDVGIL